MLRRRLEGTGASVCWQASKKGGKKRESGIVAYDTRSRSFRNVYKFMNKIGIEKRIWAGQSVAQSVAESVAVRGAWIVWIAYTVWCQATDSRHAFTHTQTISWIDYLLGTFD